MDRAVRPSPLPHFPQHGACLAHQGGDRPAPGLFLPRPQAVFQRAGVPGRRTGTAAAMHAATDPAPNRRRRAWRAPARPRTAGNTVSRQNARLASWPKGCTNPTAASASTQSDSSRQSAGRAASQPAASSRSMMGAGVMAAIIPVWLRPASPCRACPSHGRWPIVHQHPRRHTMSETIHIEFCTT